MRFFDQGRFVFNSNKFVAQGHTEQIGRLDLRGVALAAIAVSLLLSENDRGQTVTHSISGPRDTISRRQQTKSEKSATSDEKQCDFSGYKPVKISDFFTGASIVKHVDAIYPSLAIPAHIEGEVSTRILVDRKGNVMRACALNGHPILRKAAIAAALKWKFKPWCSLCTKHPVVEGEIGFHFSLEQDKHKLE